MNSDRLQWPSVMPRLLWPPRRCPVCTSVEFTSTEDYALDYVLTWLALHPVRCVNCRRRYYTFSLKNEVTT